MLMKPDFLITPRQIYGDKQLAPLDEKVYAVVYWFSQMKDGKCTAGNRTIANVLDCHTSAVGKAIIKLEQCGAIKRTYKDDARRIRKEIIPLVVFRQTEEGGVRETGHRVPPGGGHTKTTTKKEDTNVSSPSVPSDSISECLVLFQEETNAAFSYTPPLSVADRVMLASFLKKRSAEDFARLLDVLYYDKESPFFQGKMTPMLKTVLSNFSINFWLQHS